MASLTGEPISGTYDQLLALPPDGGAGASLVALTDGDGTTTFALQISNAGIHSTGTLTVAGATTLTGAAQFNNTITVGVNDTGFDVKFFGAQSGEYLNWDQANNQLEIKANGAALLVGDQTMAIGTDPMISISRTTDTATASAHGYEDYTKFKKVGSYNSYDARTTIPAGCGNNYVGMHYLGFQAGNSYENADGALGSSGDWNDGLGGYWSIIGSASGCTVTHAKHFLVDDANLSGTTVNQYGLYAHDTALSSATNNYIIYNDDANGKLYQKGATDLYGALTAVRAAVTNLTNDASIPITSTCVNIDANGGARTGIRFAGTGAAGQIIIVNNTGGEKLTFHGTEGTALVRGIHADHDVMEANGVYIFISDGALWNYIGGGVDSQPDLGMVAS